MICGNNFIQSSKFQSKMVIKVFALILHFSTPVVLGQTTPQKSVFQESVDPVPSAAIDEKLNRFCRQSHVRGPQAINSADRRKARTALRKIIKCGAASKRRLPNRSNEKTEADFVNTALRIEKRYRFLNREQ
jgi:hypothetical protein